MAPPEQGRIERRLAAILAAAEELLRIGPPSFR